MSTFDDLVTALHMTSAALQCVAPLLPDDERHRIKFTGKWAQFGSLTIGEILDRANDALDPKAEHTDARD